MPLYYGDKNAKLFRGDYHPAELYLGDKKIAGYTKQVKSGNSITFADTYNDTADIAVSGNTVAEFNPIATTSPTFARTSTAYKQDGSVVSVGVPRIESNGVMVEEGTSNLFPVNQQNVLVNGSVNPNTYIRTSVVQGATYTVSFQKRIFADDLCTNTRSTLRVNYTDGTYTLKQPSFVVEKNGIFVTIVLTVTADSAKTVANVYVIPFDYSSSTFMHQECQNVLLEQKPYATSFHPTTRAAESLTIPASCLSATEGTIEFDVVMLLSQTLLASRLINIGDASELNVLAIVVSGAGVYGTSRANSGTYYDTVRKSILPDTKYRLSIVWSKALCLLKFYVDGVKIGENTYQVTDFVNFVIELGRRASTMKYANALFSNLRISSIARTDAELANTGALSVDEYTTYFAPFSSDLSATKRNWGVYDSTGVLTVSDKAEQSQQFTLPTLRKVGNVSDEYNIVTGIVTRNIGVQSCDAGSSWTIAGAIANSLVSTNDGEYILSGTTLTTSVPMVNSFEVLYQLATPVMENLGANTVPTYYPTTLVDTVQSNVAVSTIDVEAKVMDT